MVSGAWRALDEELARWRDAGRSVEFWWRDDDAGAADAALARLLALAARSAVPLALAVIPARADPGMFEGLGSAVSVLQHGADHHNRAAPGEKKTEFPAAEPIAAALARLGAGRARLAALAGARMVGALAPPWNRLPATLVPRLADAGLRALSQYGPRTSAEPAAGLKQVNTHVDIIAWRGARGFVGEAQALALALRHLEARREGRADAAEPTGWLTHHARHDEEAWRFLERLFEATRRAPGVRWRRAEELFR